MPKSAFTIESITIEGFKAFREPQTFHFGGKHVFVLGPNGFGKTSIIEAIRWCLFGLASRPGETVKNQFYGGTCTVRLSLSGSDGSWTLQRWLGLGGGALTIRDPSGQRRNMEDVFPQLSRIGPREGAHVIHAAPSPQQQPPSSRRPEADITDFSYTVYRYLGVEEVPRLLDKLQQLVNKWESAENEVLAQYDKLGQKISDRIGEVEEQLNRIAQDPPWGNEPSPVYETTRGKVHTLAEEAEEIGAQLPTKELAEMNPNELLDHMENAVDYVFSEKEEPLRQRLEALKAWRSRLQGLINRVENAVSRRDEAVSRLAGVERELSDLLHDASVEDLERRKAEVEQRMQQAQHSVVVIDAALKYFDSISNVTEVQCPICEGKRNAGELKRELNQRRQKADPEASRLLEEYNTLKAQIERARELQQKQREAVKQRDHWQSELENALQTAQTEFENSGLNSPDNLRQLDQQYEASINSLQQALASKDEEQKAWRLKIDELRRELRFHRLRILQLRLRNLYERYEGLNKEVQELRGFQDAVNEIHSRLGEQLGQALERVLPSVSTQMTDVYRRLTEQPIFDSVWVEHHPNSQKGSSELELKVASSKGAGSWNITSGVLNGQAVNAIRLVPYFVFSRYQEEPLLDMLLLDDPTQTFDTRRIDFLLKELADATSHAHLLVVTHEEDRILPTLTKYFDPGEVKVLKAVDLDDRGPQFEDITESL